MVQGRTKTTKACRTAPRLRARCVRCGRCCREKVEIEGVVFYTDRVCVFWDERTKLCKVFKRRRAKCPNCGDLARAIGQGLLPRDCPFVCGRKGYDGPVEFWDDPEIERILASLPEDPFTRYYPRTRLRSAAPKGANSRRRGGRKEAARGA